jgi:hypothetical protein
VQRDCTFGQCERLSIVAQVSETPVEPGMHPEDDRPEPVDGAPDLSVYRFSLRRRGIAGYVSRVFGYGYRPKAAANDEA